MHDLDSNFTNLFLIISLGSSTQNISWQRVTTDISLVQNNFMKNLLTVKSRDCRSLFDRLQTSRLYNNTGMHFSGPKMCELEWPLNVIQCVLCWIWRDASSSTRLPCLAYIKVPLSTYCKIRYVSIFTAASRGSPRDIMAFLLIFKLSKIDRQHRLVTDWCRSTDWTYLQECMCLTGQAEGISINWNRTKQSVL